MQQFHYFFLHRYLLRDTFQTNDPVLKTKRLENVFPDVFFIPWNFGIRNMIPGIAGCPGMHSLKTTPGPVQVSKQIYHIHS